MSLFQFFFPTQSTAYSVKKMSRQMEHQAHRTRNDTFLAQKKNLQLEEEIFALNERIEKLENDAGFLSLLLAALFEKLNQQQSLDLEELKTILKNWDATDGIEDGKLDINILRKFQD